MIVSFESNILIMNDSFLLKEQELIKLNKELDVKNKILQSQLKKQTHNVECSLKRTERSEKKSKVIVNKENVESSSKSISRCYVEDANTVNEFLENEFQESTKQQQQHNEEKFKEIKSKTSKSVQSKVTTPAIPEKLIKRNISSDGLIKFLKSKVSILQDELDKINKDFTKKSDELHVCLELQKQLELQRDQVISRNNTLSSQLVKMEEKCGEIELKLKERDVELISIRKDHENLKREHKTMMQSNTSLERRLAKSQEDLENMKNCLNNAQQLEKVNFSLNLFRIK